MIKSQRQIRAESTGDHGSLLAAIDFAIDQAACEDAGTFLRAWNMGDLGEWPEFYPWLVNWEMRHKC